MVQNFEKNEGLVTSVFGAKKIKNGPFSLDDISWRQHFCAEGLIKNRCLQPKLISLRSLENEETDDM